MELEIIGTIVGLAYLWLEYRASIYLWIASIIMPAIYIFVYYEAGLLGNRYLLMAGMKFGYRSDEKAHYYPHTQAELAQGRSVICRGPVLHRLRYLLEHRISQTLS